MTTSEEMIQAIESARIFLYDLMNTKATPKVPSYIRKRAFRVTKHYPMSTTDLLLHLDESATKVRQKCDSDFTDIDEAIDEIKRLREERETYFMAHDELLAQIIELRYERDEARREVCDLKTFNFDNTISAYRYADLRKWDCYKDRTDD